MPSYHSKLNKNDEGFPSCSGFLLAPLKTDARGPADKCPADVKDIIDETISFFRANVLFRNFEVQGDADRTLIYLTLYLHQCLVKFERIEDRAQGAKEMTIMAKGAFVLPGENGWPLGTLFPAPKSKDEADLIRGYMKQAREEVGKRALNLLFDEQGKKNKWWQAFSKRKFMGKELK